MSDEGFETYRGQRRAVDPECFDAEARRLREHVGQVLQDARGDRPRPEIAELLGWSSPVNVLTIEQGKDNATLGRLAKVAAACGGRLEVRFVPFDE